MRQSGHFELFQQKDFTRVKETKGTKMQSSKDIKGIKKPKNINKHISNFFPMVFRRVKTLPFFIFVCLFTFLCFFMRAKFFRKKMI